MAAWQQLAAVLDPASSDAKLIAANIEEDRRLAGGAGTAPVSVSGEITLGDALRSRAATGLTLYIVAKSVDQPGMPVAVLRTTTGQWPFRFKLDDSLALMPGRALSGAGRVTVEARISKSGLATPTAGDLAGTSGVIDPKAGRPLHIVIDRVVN
jgi:cytochrome c-type biogenesis protein CcmH